MMSPDVVEDHSSLGQRRQLFRINLQILIRHIVVDGPYEVFAERLHLADCDPFAGATVVQVVVATALWDEIIGVFDTTLKPFGAKIARRVPRTRIGVRAIKIEQDPASLRKSVAIPLECRLDPRRNRRKERIQATDLLHEWIK